MSNARVRVIDVNTNEELFDCDVKELEEAYEYAARMDEMGLDVKIIAPSITQTLTNTLGLSVEMEDEYEQSVVAEMEDHEGSCCVTNKSVEDL